MSSLSLAHPPTLARIPQILPLPKRSSCKIAPKQSTRRTKLRCSTEDEAPIEPASNPTNNPANIPEADSPVASHIDKLTVDPKQLKAYKRKCIDKTELPFELFAFIHDQNGKVYDFYENSIDELVETLYEKLGRDLNGSNQIVAATKLQPIDKPFSKNQVHRLPWEPYSQYSITGSYSDIIGYTDGWSIRNSMLEVVHATLTKYRKDTGKPDFRTKGLKPIGYLPGLMNIAAYNICTGEAGPKLTIKIEGKAVPSEINPETEIYGCKKLNVIEDFTAPILKYKRAKGMGWTDKVEGFNVPVRVICV